MLALISYPFAFEPWVTTALQAGAWSIGYALFAVLCAGSALYGLRNANVPAAAAQPAAQDTAPAPPVKSAMKIMEFDDRAAPAAHSAVASGRSGIKIVEYGEAAKGSRS